MTISQEQYVDLLVKKLYGVATTDTAVNKSPANESIPSPTLNRGDTVWTEADQIPDLAANVAGISFQYGNTNPIQCVVDDTTVPLLNSLGELIYPTWLSNTTGWITPDFGGGYSVAVYVGPPNITNLTGANVTFISSSGEGGSEPGEFYFDYQAGLLYFIGETIPNVLTSGNVVYVTGYQYSGLVGVTNLPSNTNIGNININNTTLTSTDSNLITFFGSDGIVVPSGNSAQRPGNANVGTIRFNTTIDSLETWDGAAWISGGNVIVPGTITDQQISPDGTSDTYTLTQTSTSQGILVSINGVTQLPNVAYSVTGNSITFTQIPLTQDLIDIRYISYATTISALTNSSGNAAVTVTPQGNILFTTNGNIVTTMSANSVTMAKPLSVTGNITTSGFFVGAFAGSISGDVIAPGANTQVVYNADNLLAASAGFTFNSVSNILAVSGNITSSAGISVVGNVTAGNVIATNLSGNLTSATQANITGLGTLNALTVNGNISGSNISAQSISATGNVTTGNILPGANVTYNLGSPDQQWKSLYISGNTIYIGTTNISTSGGNLFFGNNAVVVANTPITGDVITSGNVSAAGNIMAGRLFGEGGNLSNITAANVNGTVSAAEIAEIAYSVSGGNVTGQVGNALIAGTVTTNAQPNITSTGTLTSLSVTGNISVGGNITGNANILGNGVISTTGNITGLYILGNGSLLSGIASSYGNANVAAYLPTYTGILNPGSISATGNIQGSYILGNGAFLTGIPASYGNTNVANYLPTYTGNLTAGNISVSGNITGNKLTIGIISSTGNITATAISTTGNITAPYFIGNVIGNISGNLNAPGTNTQVLFNNNNQINASAGLTFDFSSNALVSTGTITGSNFLTGGIISATGNITGNYYIGNGAALNGLTAANIIGNVAIANYATTSGAANTVTTNAQPNITSVGTLSSLSVTGNTTSGNLLTAGAVSAAGNISTNGYFIGNFQGNITGNLSVPGSNTQIIYNANGNAGASAGLTFNAGTNALISTGTITGSNFLTGGYISAGGNIIGNYYIGNASTLSDISGANVTGIVANAAYATAADTASTVTTNAQPNITSVGTLSSLSVTGTTVSGNLLTAGVVSATGNISTSGYFLGNFQGNVTGNLTVPGSNTQIIYNNNDLAGASAGLTFNAGTNALISTGTITGSNFLTGGFISAGGNIIGNEFIGAGNALSNIQGANVNGTVTNATYAVSADSAATITANAQPNITSVGTLSSLTVTATTTSGNLLTTNLISSAGNIIANGYFIGTFLGNISGNLTAPGANTQVLYNNSGNAGASAGFTFNSASNILSVSGNVVGSNVNTGGSISATGNISSGNVNTTNIFGTAISVTSTVTAGQFIGAGNALSNIQGANVSGIVASANIANTITGNAQANITSVGVLTSLSVSGNAAPGNLITAGVVSATGNISTAGYFIGNFQGNITGNLTVPGSNTQVIYNASGNAGASAGFIFNAGTNAVSITGNTTSGNILSNGIISAVGNITGGNITGGNVSATNHTGTTVSVTGTVTSSQFIGSGNTLSNIQGANVSGNVTTAITSGTVTTNAQPNITSIGVLTTLSVTGNINVGNLSTAGNVAANLFVGNFQGNITGNLTVPGSNTQIIYNANGIAGASAAFTFNAGTNAVTISGNTTSGNMLTGGIVSATGNVTALGFISTGGTGIISGSGNIIGGNILTTGVLSATGNVTGNYILGNGALLTGVSTSSSNLSNGTSNIVVSANSNVTIGVTGNTVATFASTGIYNPGIHSVGGNITTSANIILTGIGNINGYNGYFANNLTVLGTLGVSIGAGTFLGNLTNGNSALYAGVAGYTVLGSNVVVQYAGNANSYSQVNFQNINSGTLASTDMVLTANNGNDTAYYADFGITGNNHVDTAFFGDSSTKNDTYLYTVATSQAGPSTTSGPGNLILGSTNGQIKLFVGNTAQANVIQQVSSIGIAITGLVSATGNIYGNAFISAGSGAGSISGTGNITGGNLISTGIISTSGNIYGGNIINAGISKDRIYTVATLPAAATAGSGARAFVSDSNSTTFYGVVSGSGSNAIPVFSDGTSWRIG